MNLQDHYAELTRIAREADKLGSVERLLPPGRLESILQAAPERRTELQRRLDAERPAFATGPVNRVFTI